MGANNYYNQIEEMNKQAQKDIIALLKEHNIFKLDFYVILNNIENISRDKQQIHFLKDEGDRLQEMLNEHLIQMPGDEGYFIDCHLLSITRASAIGMVDIKEICLVEYTSINGGQTQDTKNFDLYTSVQILGLLEEFFAEFDYDQNAKTIRFKPRYTIVEYVDGKQSAMSHDAYDEKSDAIKEMLNCVASYDQAEITHIEVDKDKVRLLKQDTMITYQVEEV